MRHVIKYNYIVIPASDILEYLTVVFLFSLDILNVVKRIEYRKESFALKVMACSDYDNLGLFLLLISKVLVG